MIATRKSVRISACISFVLTAFVIFGWEQFLAEEEYGKWMLIAAIGCAVLVWPLSAVRMERPKWLRCILQLILFAGVPLAMMVAVERLNGNFITGFLTSDDLPANYVVYLLFYLFVFVLSGSARTSILTVSPVLLLFGIANMYIKEFKGGPLLPMDFTSWRTAANVATGYNYEIGYEIRFAAAITAAVMAAASRLRMPRMILPLKIVTRGLAAAVIAGFAIVFFGTDLFADEGLKPDFFNQTRGYEHHGAVLEFTINTKYLALQEPSGYSWKDVEDIVAETVGDGEVPTILESALIQGGMSEEEAYEQVHSVETAGERGITPNLIVIMDEAFSDLRVVGDFETNEPVMPFIDSLKENAIGGYSYVSVIGTGTSNTEFEFLTGDSMAFLPAGSNAYQLYVKNTQPSLVSTLQAQEYGAIAIHPYFQSSWNRPEVYGLLGFQDFISMEDLLGEDLVEEYISSGYSFNLYQRLVRENFPGEDILLRRFVSDDYDFKKLIELYEERDPDEPFFVFNVTMQNHSSYDKEYDNFEQKIWLENMEKEYPKTNQYLSLVRATDEAFEELVEYFEQQEEPTIILLFGDHQPFIESGFYSKVMGQSVTELDDETQQKRYISRFVLWANYDIPEGWVEEISVNYLSTMLLQVAGLEMTPYNTYLSKIYASVPVITAMGCRDTDGNFFQADEKNPHQDLISGYRKVAYNNLADYQHQAKSLFYIGEAAQ